MKKNSSCVTDGFWEMLSMALVIFVCLEIILF